MCGANTVRIRALCTDAQTHTRTHTQKSSMWFGEDIWRMILLRLRLFDAYRVSMSCRLLCVLFADDRLKAVLMQQTFRIAPHVKFETLRRMLKQRRRGRIPGYLPEVHAELARHRFRRGLQRREATRLRNAHEGFVRWESRCKAARANGERKLLCWNGRP